MSFVKDGCSEVARGREASFNEPINGDSSVRCLMYNVPAAPGAEATAGEVSITCFKVFKLKISFISQNTTMLHFDSRIHRFELP